MHLGTAMRTHGIGLEVFGRTDIGKVRERNEDAFVIADLMRSSPVHAMRKPLEVELGVYGVLLAVSDGMGGAQAGAVASALTLQSLQREISAADRTVAATALTESVQRANHKVWDAASALGREGMGATLTAVLIDGRRAYVAEVGDSRAYVLRSGRLVALTHDQSVVQLMLDAGTLTREQALNFPYKNVIAQAIGTSPKVVVALNRFTLRRGDRLLLCSDGLTGKVSDDELASVVASTPILDAVAGRLVDLANARGGDDNVTVLLADMHGDGLPLPMAEERVSLETVQAYPG